MIGEVEMGEGKAMSERLRSFGMQIKLMRASNLVHDGRQALALVEPMFEFSAQQRTDAIQGRGQVLVGEDLLGGERIEFGQRLGQFIQRPGLDGALGVLERGNAFERIDDAAVFAHQDQIGIFAHQFDVDGMRLKVAQGIALLDFGADDAIEMDLFKRI